MNILGWVMWGAVLALRSFRIVLFQERIEEGSDASASDHRNNFKYVDFGRMGSLISAVQ